MQQLDEVFRELKSILECYEESLVVKTDEPESYYLDSRHIMKNGKPLFFASVKRTKNYVGFHLMPVYVEPELLKGMSPELKTRMHGKSCFNFRKLEEIPEKELVSLTEKGFQYYQDQEYI